MEYDQNEGIARAKGEVFMDIQPPQGLANGGRSAAPPSAPAKASPPAPVIHVRTSGLVYLRKLGVASTDQQVEFSYGEMTCTALGAEFNTDQATRSTCSPTSIWTAWPTASPCTSLPRAPT